MTPEEDLTPEERLSELQGQDLGVDFSTRRIFLVGDIDENMSKAFIQALHVLDKTPGSVSITLNSGGGEEVAGYAIYDAIKLARSPAAIEVFGQASSIAAAVFQAGHSRGIAPHADFMIHNGDREVGTTENNSIQRTAKNIERDSLRYWKVLLEGAQKKNPKMTMRRIKGMCDRETYLTAEEAVKCGFADWILTARP